MSMTLTPSSGPMVSFAPDPRAVSSTAPFLGPSNGRAEARSRLPRIWAYAHHVVPALSRDPYSQELQLKNGADTPAQQQTPVIMGPCVRRDDRIQAYGRLLRGLQQRDVIRDRSTTHVEDAGEFYVLDLHALRRLTQQLHRGHHMHGNAGSADR